MIKKKCICKSIKIKQPSNFSLTTQFAHNSVLTGTYSKTGPTVGSCGLRKKLKEKSQWPLYKK